MISCSSNRMVFPSKDAEPIALKPGIELCDLRIGATHPALYFTIALPEEALVTIYFQEFNIASRCMLLMSPTCVRPSTESAVWRLTSPQSNKTVTIHPADDNYRLGQLYVAVRYLEESGSTFVRIAVDIQPSFYSMWYCRALCLAPRISPHAETIMLRNAVCRPSNVPANFSQSSVSGTPPPESTPADVIHLDCGSESCTSSRSQATDITPNNESDRHLSCSLLYVGAWRGSAHHGLGIAYYAVTEGPQSLLEVTQESRLLLLSVYERHNLPWSALTIPEDTQFQGVTLDNAFIARLSGVADLHAATGWSVLSALGPGVEAYYGDWVMGKKDGFGVYQWSDRAYVGQWQRGVREGHGTLTCKDGYWYRGDWHKDRRHGAGEAYTLPEGNVYKGEWKEGLRHGTGSLTFVNGVVVHGTWVADVLQPVVHAVYTDNTTYDGEWLVNCRHGNGVFTDVTQCVHTSIWQHDLRQGPGTIQLPNGVTFDGTYKDDVKVDGVYRFPNGDQYRGVWDHDSNVRNGHGRCESRNGDVYEGNWVSDMRDGQGTMTYAATGAVYEGSWTKNRRHGHGILWDKDGTYEGIFENDERCGTGTQVSPDGSFYKGTWRRNHRAGHGLFYVATEDITYEGVFLYDRLVGKGSSVRHLDKVKYEGTWLDGKEQGYGTRTLPSGDVIRGVWHRGVPQNGLIEYESTDGVRYVGDWYDGLRSGEGMQVSADGSVYDGHWLNDKRHGHGRLTHPNGEVVECEWHEGSMMDGAASLEFLDGSVYVGTMQDGIPHGRGTLTYLDGTVFEGTFQDGVYSL